MSDMRKLIESVERLNEARREWDVERIVQPSGGLTNVNIDRSLDSKLFTNLRNGGESYSRDDVVKVYYRDEERLQSFLDSSDGRGAREVGDTASSSSDDADRRVPSMGNWGFRADHSAINRIFDSKVRGLGRDPSLEGIQSAFRDLRSELEDGSHDVSRAYSERQFLGAVAKQIRVDGLFNSNNRTITMAEKDSNGNYNQARGASERLARALADRGLLPEEAAENIGFLGGLGGGIGYSDEDRAQNAGVNASRQGQQRMRTQARRFLELLAKRNESDAASLSDSVTYISSLARLLTEALSPAEEAEFQELLQVFKDTSSLDQIDDEETVRLITQAREAAANVEPAAAEPAAEPAAAAAADNARNDADSRDSGTPAAATGEGMSLRDFAESGKGGLKNDTNETRAITELQEFLKTMGWDIGVDGRYGPQTTTAVKEFQQLVGVTDDGDAGPETIAKVLVWGRLPDVKTWAAQLKELTDLIEKGAVFQQGEQPAATQQNSSKDFRSLISIVESMLSEAVTEQEQARAMELYNELKTKLDDGEYQSGLPQELQQQFTTVGEWARATGDSISNAPAEETPTVNVDALDAAAKAAAIYRGLDGAGTDEESVIAVLGSIRNAEELQAVERIFLELSGGTAMKDWLDSDVTNMFSSGAQTQIDDIYTRLAGDPNADPGSVEAITDQVTAAQGLYQAMKGGWLFGLGTGEQAVLAILGKITTNSWPNIKRIYQQQYNADLLQHFEEEFSGNDLANLNTALERFGERVGQEEFNPQSMSDFGPAA